MGNLFTEEQIKYFYRDHLFVSFLSDYFASYEAINQKTDMDLDYDGIDNINIYARILIANAGSFFEMLESLNKRISFSHRKVVRSCQGEIRGSLLINQYAKEIVSHHFPRKYECIQRKKTFCTPENILIYYAVLKIRECIGLFLYSIQSVDNEIKKRFHGSFEYNKIHSCIGYCERILSSELWGECREDAQRYLNTYGINVPSELIECVENRIRDGRIANVIVYKDIVKWIKRFLKRGISFITSECIETLRYDELFSDVLFELWTLFCLKSKVSETCCLNTLEYYRFDRKDGVVFKGEKDGNIIEFIYQKGSGLYWDENADVSWKYCSPRVKKLIGKPDISIRVSGTKNRLIMFDAKNRIRENGQVSEEVYKMIGYFDNFREMLEGPKYLGTPKECILFFRGDEKTFIKELEKSNSDYRIRAISVSPTADNLLNSNQFQYVSNVVKKIIDY